MKRPVSRRYRSVQSARANDPHHGKYGGQDITLDEASQMKERERLLPSICFVRPHQSPSTAGGVRKDSKSEEKLPQQDHADLKDALIMPYNETIKLFYVEMSTARASRFGDAGQSSIEQMIDNFMSDRLSINKVIRQPNFRKGRPQARYQYCCNIALPILSLA